MKPIIHSGAALTIEVATNGTRTPVIRIWSLITDQVLYVATGSPATPRVREGIVSQLPGDYRDEAAALLLEVADRVAEETIDAALAAAEGRGAATPGDAPWPEPVDGAALYDELQRSLQGYLVLPNKAAAQALALWTLFCHAHDCFEFSPLLLVTGPTKACGKTRVCDVLRHLVARALPCVGISDAALFRLIEDRHPTVMVDEADNIDWRTRKELAALLNSGFTRGAARIPRCVGDEHEVKEFSTWCPKVLAGKNGRRILLDTTVSRSIVIVMRKRLKTETVERFREKRAAAELGPLRRQAARWAADNAAALAEVEPAAYDLLDDRAEDAWMPLFAIADTIGVGTEARRAALVLSGGDAAVSDDVNVELLRDVRQLFADRGDPKHLPTSDLLTGLRAMEEAPWGSWSKGKGIRDRELAKHLQEFGVHSKSIRTRGPDGKERSPRGYSLDTILVALAPYDDCIRYGATSDGTKGLIPRNPTTTEESSSGTETASKSFDANESSAVADQETGNRCRRCGTADCIGTTCMKCDAVGWVAAWKAQRGETPRGTTR